MHRTRRAAPMTLMFLAVVPAALTACALDGMIGGNGPSDEEAAMMAMNADAQPRLLVEAQVLSCVSAAGLAANLTGASAFVTTGTVDVRGAEPTYSASPNDELVLREDGGDTRYLIDQLVISEVDSVVEILLHDHQVRTRAIRDDAFDLDLVSVRENDDLERSAEGIFEEDGFTFELELAESGSSSTEFDGDLVRYDSNTHRGSRVTGDELEVEVDEDEDYILMISDDAFENRTTMTSIDGTVTGKSVRMDEGRVRRSFQNAAAVEPDFWAETAGELELNGEVVGELAFTQGEGGAYQIVLELQGEDEVLESFSP